MVQPGELPHQIKQQYAALATTQNLTLLLFPPPPPAPETTPLKWVVLPVLMLYRNGIVQYLHFTSHNRSSF